MTATSLPSNVVKYPTNRYYLTVISPHGSVVQNPNQASYANGDSINLTATAFTGWHFSNWTGNVPGSPNAANPVTVTVGSSDLTVTANYTPTTPTISGNAGVGAALLSYNGGSTVADAGGNYSFSVAAGWTGTVTPSKTGYTFSPANRIYSTPVNTNQAAQDFTASPITFTISGTTAVGGVTLSYTDGTLKTINSDASGVYSLSVSYGFTGTVVPSKTAYTFLPVSRSYTNLLSNQASQNYAATPIMETITGNAGVAGAVLSYMDGTLKTSTANGSGIYTISVLYNWSGTITPSLPGYTFTPVNRVYPAVLVNQTGQDYSAVLLPNTISGNAGVAGATLTYTDGLVKTATADASGNYAMTVSVGWTGTVTPSKTGYTFLPAFQSYNNLLVSQTGQNYVATPNTYTISGNVGVAGATLSYTDGTPKTATADASGNYTFTISYSTIPVTVTPSLTDYTFLPVNRTYTSILSDQLLQNYTATGNIYTISGNAGVAGATLSYTDGTPKTTIADAIGNYSFAISHSNLPITVTPSMAGYTFLPVNRTYNNVISNQSLQNYTATPITYTISGNAGVTGVTLTYTDGLVVKTALTDASGNYSLNVSYNWSGTITPSLWGYEFSPKFLSYSNVLADISNQNYLPIPVTYIFLPLINK